MKCIEHERGFFVDPLRSSLLGWVKLIRYERVTWRIYVCVHIYITIYIHIYDISEKNGELCLIWPLVSLARAVILSLAHSPSLLLLRAVEDDLSLSLSLTHTHTHAHTKIHSHTHSGGRPRASCLGQGRYCKTEVCACHSVWQLSVCVSVGVVCDNVRSS